MAARRGAPERKNRRWERGGIAARVFAASPPRLSGCVRDPPGAPQECFENGGSPYACVPPIYQNNLLILSSPHESLAVNIYGFQTLQARTGAWHSSHVPRRSRAWRDPPPEEEGSAVEPRASGGRARGEGRGPLSGDVGLPLCPPLRSVRCACVGLSVRILHGFFHVHTSLRESGGHCGGWWY